MLGGSACSGAKRLNVILVTLDTTRADFFGSYGRPGDPTPSFDALAADGTRFDLAISTASLTPVSHASILTGLNNRDHGLRVLSAEGGFRLGADVPTLATVLRGQGYETAAVHSAFPVSSVFGFQNGFDVFESLEGDVVPLGPKGERRTWDLRRLQRRSDDTTNRALEFVHATEQPYFLWIHYWDPHDAVLMPPKEQLPQNLYRKNAAGDVVPSFELYEAEVRYVDSQFGRLIAALKENGTYDDTIVVVVSDHGEGLGDHGWEHHRILYQEDIRVPMMVRVPGKRTTPAVSSVVSTTDIYPTVLDYLGIAPPRPVSGTSLRTLMEGGQAAPRVVFADQVNGYDWNAHMVDDHPQYDFLYCAMDDRWKLIYRPTRPAESELYDVRADPHEVRNRFAEQPEEVRRLQRELAKHDGWVTAPLEGDAGGGTSQGQQSALNALGYAGGIGPTSAADVRWAWTCPVHSARRDPERGRCEECGSTLILVGRE